MLKGFIIEKLKDYKFKLVKINEPSSEFLNLIKNHKSSSNHKFKEKLKKIRENDLANFIFLLRVLDFRLWEFKENWKYRDEVDFWGLMERLIDLIKIENLLNINFTTFKKIISPKESLTLAKLRYRIFKNSLNWLYKNYDGDFLNYFEENKKPLDFCLNLLKLEKFQDYYNNIYFLKPNQLLYLEFIISKNLLKKFESELNELTIFADYKLVQTFLNFGIIYLPKKYLEKIKRGKIIKKQSILENELRAGAIFVGEILVQKLKLPSYLIDNLIWDLSHKIKLKIPHPKVKTIFY